MSNEKKYLSEIFFQNLENWSVQYLKGTSFSYNKKFDLVRIEDFLTRNKKGVEIQDNKEYKRVTIKMNNKGVLLRDTEQGKNIGTKKQFIVQGGEFIMSKIDARNGAFGIVPKSLKGAIITNDFPSFNVDESQINIEFFVYLISTSYFIKFAQTCSSGTTGRQRIDMDLFLKTKIPLPSLEEQNKLVENFNQKITEAENAEKKSVELEKSIEEYLMEELGIEKMEEVEKKKGLQEVRFKDIFEWGVENLLNNNFYNSKKFPMQKIQDFTELVRGVTYSKKDEINKEGNIVLRANNIDLSGELNLSDIKHINKKFSEEKKLNKNDLFICLASGSKKHIGKVSLIKEDTNYYFGGFMGAVRILNSELKPHYLLYILNSVLFNSYLRQQIFGANINNLNSTLFYNFQIPLPPLPIQQKIVQKISAMKTEIKELKKLAEENRKLAIEEFEKEIFM